MGKKEKKMLRNEMGMIFQSAALFDSMTVFDNVMFPLNMFSNDKMCIRDRPISSSDKLMVKFGHEYAEEGDNLIVIPEEEEMCIRDSLNTVLPS